MGLRSLLVLMRDVEVGKRWTCEKELRLGSREKQRLAQLALDQSDPGCRLAQIDPPSVVALSDYYKSGARSLLAQITCN